MIPSTYVHSYIEARSRQFLMGPWRLQQQQQQQQRKMIQNMPIDRATNHKNLLTSHKVPLSFSSIGADFFCYMLGYKGKTLHIWSQIATHFFTVCTRHHACHHLAPVVDSSCLWSAWKRRSNEAWMSMAGEYNLQLKDDESSCKSTFEGGAMCLCGCSQKHN